MRIGTHRRALLLASVCSILLLALLPTGAAGRASAPSGHNGRSTEVTIVTLALEPAALAFYAERRGLFSQQGIEAKIVATRVAALLSGDAQFSGLNVGGAAILKSRNAPIRLVAAGAVYKPSAPTTGLVAAPGQTISSAGDLVGKTIAIDQTNTIAHIALLKWLKERGVSAGDVHLVEIPFAQMLGPLQRRTVDAAVLPEPFLTLALQRGAKRFGRPIAAVCSQDCLLTIWMARKDVDATLTARFRNAMQAAAVWANQKRNDALSAAILAKYVPVDKVALAKMTRTRFAQRLRPAMAQPWIDVYAEFGVIPSAFRAIDLLK